MIEIQARKALPGASWSQIGTDPEGWPNMRDHYLSVSVELVHAILINAKDACVSTKLISNPGKAVMCQDGEKRRGYALVWRITAFELSQLGGILVRISVCKNTIVSVRISEQRAEVAYRSTPTPKARLVRLGNVPPDASTRGYPC